MEINQNRVYISPSIEPIDLVFTSPILGTSETGGSQPGSGVIGDVEDFDVV